MLYEATTLGGGTVRGELLIEDVKEKHHHTHFILVAHEGVGTKAKWAVRPETVKEVESIGTANEGEGERTS